TIIWCLLLAKGKVLGHIIGIIGTILYIISSAFVAYYGEIIISVGLTIPMSIWATISWFKNKRVDTEQGRVVVIKKIKSIELVILLLSQIVMGVGYYFLLKAFNTQFLVMSTISLVVSIIATYLAIRRSDLNWIAWIINSIMTLTLWLYLTITINLSYITLSIMSVFLFVNNIYGYINWQILKRSQKKDKK
ncbi:MAG: nicotinamide riboside transporter PnuC, partial [Clostridia bacterium]|nr:nicotinamide riboside transporter PnuC [Clostridia bacterium]